jgi:hypothetical protein
MTTQIRKIFVLAMRLSNHLLKNILGVLGYKAQLGQDLFGDNMK